MTTSEHNTTVFEIFVQGKFCDLELAAIIHTLQTANMVHGAQRFAWRIISDRPGIVQGAGACLVRAEPVIPDHCLADFLIVISSRTADPAVWMARIRSMRRLGRTVILLADAATTFIARTQIETGAVTTHWADAVVLRETQDQPRLTENLSEFSNGIITAAGRAATAELVIGLLARDPPVSEITEIGRHLLLPEIRTSSSTQPFAPEAFHKFYDEAVSDALAIMGENLSDPLSIAEIASQVDISQRCLERRFRAVFETSPGHYYKQLRVRRAHHLIQSTKLPLIDIAAATGFGATGTLATAFRKFYGITPTDFRGKHRERVLDYSAEV
ncbi:AraC family transcriptional regulator [Roseovarius sp. A46]|uniref:GlxA family transcriptional regulator n=1 Tax=Roseovarius sp. A46 TaxID=2109331 RepID=UPI0010121EE6|nr:helix-turn-helix domain-containing protein [Roseovarius sp. A46]RXV70201.1 AraC family transcriptional regulator [Roseovarius sp. A46]